MAVTCDGIVGDKPCGKAATRRVDIYMRNRLFAMDLCRICGHEVEAFLVKRGGASAVAQVDYKPRMTYVAKSGRTFTAEEARVWLVKNRLASPTGRLSKNQIAMYADKH